MEQEFKNEQISIEALPSVVDITYSQVEPQWWKASLISVGVTFFVLIALTLGVWVYTEFSNIILYIILALMLILGLLLVLYIWVEYKYLGYALREKDIIVREGALFKSTIAVPFNRIQHCEVSQGPVDRYFGLSSLTIYTAGGSSGDVEISGLSPGNAAKLKDFIVKKTGIEDEEE